MDGSSIDFLGNFKGGDRRERIGIYAIYNAAVDGEKFLFFDYLNRKAYITYACFSDCRPEYTSLDFKHGYMPVFQIVVQNILLWILNMDM